MSSIADCEPVRATENPKAYRNLTEFYLNWVHELDCDKNYNKTVRIGNEQRRVTFMRDDSIGDPKDPGDKYDNIQEISMPVGTDVFFPVYYFHSSKGEGRCETLKDCIEVAKTDLRKINTKNGKRDIWAKISKGDEAWQDITTDFDDYNVTFPVDPDDRPITVRVGDDNRLNREPDYHLPRGSHEGAVLGTFMYLRNFKKGKYVLDFGGNASNFSTRSVYTLHVE